MKLISIVVLLSGLACHAQTTQAPATQDELEYFRFLLMSAASIHHPPDSISNFERLLAKQFALNSQESAVIHAAGQELNALLKQLRQSAVGISADRTSPTEANKAALRTLNAQREDKINSLANRILSQVRPETAARLRAPGRVLARSRN